MTTFPSHGVYILHEFVVHLYCEKANTEAMWFSNGLLGIQCIALVFISAQCEWTLTVCLVFLCCSDHQYQNYSSSKFIY